jgi:hypothetical protein
VFGLIFPKWPWLVAPAVLSALAVGWLALTLHNADVIKRNADWQDKLDKAVAARTVEMYDKCKAAQAITEKVSHEYQSDLADLNSQLNTLRLRVGPSRCVPVNSGNTASGHDGAPAKNELPQRNGLSAWYLIDFAGRAENTRLQLLSCQNFVRRAQNVQ